MRLVAVVGSRHIKVNRPWVAGLVQDRVKAYGDDLTITSLGCNWGFGRDVKDYCREFNIKFCEFMVAINDVHPKEAYSRLQKARHASLVEAVDEFYIATPGTEHMEDLVTRVGASAKTHYLFNKDFQLTDVTISTTDHSFKPPKLTLVDGRFAIEES